MNPSDSCGHCGRLYRIVRRGLIPTHGAPAGGICPGSEKPPAEDRTYSSTDAVKLTGVANRQLQRWVEAGYISVAVRRDVASSHRRYATREILVARLMKRLLDGGLGSLEAVARLARAHYATLDVMHAIGYRGESQSTEHTIGEGLILTIGE